MPEEKSYRQSKNAIIVSYVIYRWYLGLLTCFILPLLDWLNYKNTKLTFEDNFIVFVTGSLATNSKEIPYEDIKNVRVDQSLIGQWFHYGTVNIVMKDSADIISFKFVHEPETVRRAVQKMYVTSTKLKLS